MILRFINRFKRSNPVAMEKAFTEGNCYWFAVILKKMFDGEIIYNPVQNHFALLLNDMAYDITGEVDPTGFFPWDWYRRTDRSEYVRIRKQCIRLEEQ